MKFKILACCFAAALTFSSEIIYGVMITGLSPFHKKMAKCAIDSFFAQTYPNKHLIVVNDGDYSVAGQYPGQITEVRLKEKRRLGELRNISLEKIPENAMWVQWDDDDWNHPRRIQDQYEEIIAQNAEGCLMARFIYYAFDVNGTMNNRSRICPGTIMCRKKGDIRYPDHLGIAEDLHYRNDYWKKYKLFAWCNPRHYLIKLCHEKNVWAIGFGKRMGANRWRGNPDAKKYLRKALKENYLFVYEEMGLPIPRQLK